MAKIRIIKKNNDCSMEYEVGDICEVTGTWYGGVHINGRSGIPVSLDKEEYMELNTEPEEPDSAENENTLETPEHDIHAGDIVQHFKREWVSPDTSEYLYKVLAVAHHTENGEKLMIYQALYAPFKICARPYDMFMSEVDRDKYPDIKQKYRFELIDIKTGKSLETDAVYDSEDGSVEYAGQAESRQSISDRDDFYNTDSKAGTFREDNTFHITGAEEPQEESKLIRFLDAYDYKEKLDILTSMRSELNDGLIDIMAESIEVAVPEGDITDRYNSLRKCLMAHTKYEGLRLRQ